MRQRLINIELKRLGQGGSEKIVEYHMKQLEIKEKEIDLKRKVNDSNYEFVKHYLKLQAENFRENNKKEILKNKYSIVVLSISIFLFFGFLTTALIMDKDELLADIVKAAVYLSGGAITGYGVAVQKGKVDKAKSANQSD